MEWTLWTLALCLTLLNYQLPLFQGWLGGNGTLQPKKCNPMPTKSSTFHPPVGSCEKSSFSKAPRTPLPQSTGELHPLASIVAAKTTFFTACILPNCMPTCFLIWIFPALVLPWRIRVFAFSFLPAVTGCFLFSSKHVSPTHAQIVTVSLYTHWLSIMEKKLCILELSEMEWVILKYKYLISLVGGLK